MNFCWAKVFWYVLVNFKTHGRCANMCWPDWRVKHSTIQPGEIAWSQGNLGHPLFEMAIQMVRYSEQHQTHQTYQTHQTHQTYGILMIWDMLGKHINFCPPSFDAFGCLTTLRHDSFSQSLAHGSDGTVLHRINFCHDHQCSLGHLENLMLGIGSIVRYEQSLKFPWNLISELVNRVAAKWLWVIAIPGRWTQKQLVVVAVHAPVSPPPAILSVTLSQQNGLREKIQNITINSMVET